MSFNISGIVINKSFKDNKEELSKVLGFNIDFEKEIDFETASENNKEEGIVDVYFSEKGTVILIDSDLCLDTYSYPQINILTFVLSENSMSFYFGYSENNNVIRSKMEVNGKVLNKEGNKLQIENEIDDVSEVIWKQIETVLGKPFWSIEPEEKVYRFSIKNNYFEEDSNSVEQQKLLETGRLNKTESYKIIDEISDILLKKTDSWGKFDEERLKDEQFNFVNDIRNKEFVLKNYKDIIDIYFLMNSFTIIVNRSVKNLIMIQTIEFFSFNFRNDALDYLDKFAFVNCPEQKYALRLLCLQLSMNRRKEETFRKIRQNFDLFNDETKSFVVQYCSTNFPNEKINFNNSKKWWQFWK